MPPSKSHTDYIFIDYENVPETDLSGIAGKSAKVILVLGERHKNLPLTLVKTLLRFPSQVELVEAGRNGKNALDMVLCYYIGLYKATNPAGCFHVVSRDKDFDPLIGHLTDRGTRAGRHESLAAVLDSMGNSMRTDKPVGDDRVATIEQRLKALSKGRPIRAKSMLSYIQVQFPKRLKTEEAQAVIDGLISKELIEVLATGAIIYKF